MDFMQWKISGTSGDLIRVRLDKQAYVRLFDPMNFESFRRGAKSTSEGGWSERLDVEFTLPYKGTFHVVVDLGGTKGTVKATCDILRR